MVQDQGLINDFNTASMEAHILKLAGQKITTAKKIINKTMESHDSESDRNNATSLLSNI